jgi:hypothetical protein
MQLYIYVCYILVSLDLLLLVYEDQKRMVETNGIPTG